MKISLLWTKRLIIFFHDVMWIPLSIWLAYWFRFNLSSVPETSLPGLWQLLIVATIVHVSTFWFLGCYRGIWRFASLPDLVRILKAVVLGALISAGALLLYSRFAGVPRTAIVLYPIFLFLGVSMSRVLYRVIKTHHIFIDITNRKKALIVGAGRAGDILIRDLLEHATCMPVAIVDDDKSKQGKDLHGIRVMGTISDLRDIVETYNIDSVLVAIPSAPRSAMDAIVKTCAEMHIPCRTLPSLLELADGSVAVSRLRPVTVGDLLGREPVKLDNDAIDAYLTGKRIAITGGGGSIGSELCRQVLVHNPKYLLIIESSEFNLYQIEKELSQKYPDVEILPMLADIRIPNAMESIFSKYAPEVVFHAAAYKHVPLVEENIIEAVRNNVCGSKVVADTAVKYGVKTFVLVSTDKTVNPTNVMGASKRIAEIYCQTLNSSVGTHFVTTRFGNVLGSAGSVVPLFERQIKSGGPITITHPEITRYFMTIQEAASLILQAGAMGKGGEIFVLDMGKPIKIKDLAEQMVRLSGLTLGEDVRIEYIGLRPGEKMHEELFYSKEKLVGTGHHKLMLANSCSVDLEWLEKELCALSKFVHRYDENSVVSIVKNIVPEYVQSISTTEDFEEQSETPRLSVIK